MNTLYTYIYKHKKTTMNYQYALRSLRANAFSTVCHYLENFIFDEVPQFLIVQHHREINM